MTTFQHNRLYRYRSPMGAIGAGFLIEFAGRPQHSVAWPDGAAQRYKDDELSELGIQCYESGSDTDGVADGDPRDLPSTPAWEAYHGAVEAWIRNATENGTTAEALEEFAAEYSIDRKYLQWRIDEASDSSVVNDSAPEGDAGDSQTPEEAPAFAFKPDDTEANNIREYLRTFPAAENQEVIAGLNKLGMQVSSSQVSAARKQLAKLAEKEAPAGETGGGESP